MRRYFQYGLKTIILLTVVAAIALTWWRQRALLDELAAAQKTIERLEEQLKHNDTISDICLGIDLENPKHREAFAALQHMGWPLCERQEVGRLEVVLCRQGVVSIPGTQASAAFVLTRHGNVADAISVETRTREWSQNIKLEDVDADGIIEVTIQLTPTTWHSTDPQPVRVVYAVVGGEFVEHIGPPICNPPKNRPNSVSSE